jgi:hypothetical protein
MSQYGNLFLAVDQIAFSTRCNQNGFSNTTFSLSLSGDRSFLLTAGDFQGQSQDSVPYQPFDDTSSGATIKGRLTSLHIINGFTRKSTNPCRLQISLHFMIAVVAINMCKLATMLYVLLTDRSEHIVTLGDAAASFLKDPD